LPSKPKPTLDELMAKLVAETPDVRVNRDAEYARAGIVFAALPATAAVELRLGPEIAEAALRTPHTSTSPRGEDWISLKPVDWGEASDRLEAWYRVAWRLAAKRGSRR
jgi:hypothetical protein